MPVAEYKPNDTTATMDVAVANGGYSLSLLPDTEDLVFVHAGFLPRDQEYYWTEEWQAGERETLAEIERGEGVEFDNAEDLIRWLYEAD